MLELRFKAIVYLAASAYGVEIYQNTKTYIGVNGNFLVTGVVMCREANHVYRSHSIILLTQ